MIPNRFNQLGAVGQGWGGAERERKRDLAATPEWGGAAAPLGADFVEVLSKRGLPSQIYLTS